MFATAKVNFARAFPVSFVCNDDWRGGFREKMPVVKGARRLVRVGECVQRMHKGCGRGLGPGPLNHLG